MKPSIYIFSLLVTLLSACSTSTENNTTEAKTTPKPREVLIETVTIYDSDSLTKEVFQVDKITNQKEGWYKLYDEQGQIQIERYYKQDKADSLEKNYYANGKLKSKMLLDKGEYHGKFYYYFEDGTIRQEGEFVHDKMEGLLKTYYANGNLKEEVSLVANMTQGAFKEYNENGTIKTEGNYNTKEDIEDLETGLLKIYNGEGVLIEKRICNEGQCCKIWEKGKGDVPPSSDYCANIIQSMSKEDLQ